MKLRAEFPGGSDVTSVVDSLVQEGLDPASFEIYSSKPIEISTGAVIRKTRMSLYAVLGAILSGGCATAWLFWAQLDYPVVTGGMPITSGWATGVITYETTMAGAVAGVLGGFLWEGGFLRRWRRGPEVALDTESIVLELSCAPAHATSAEMLLRSAGAETVEKREVSG